MTMPRADRDIRFFQYYCFACCQSLVSLSLVFLKSFVHYVSLDITREIILNAGGSECVCIIPLVFFMWKS